MNLALQQRRDAFFRQHPAAKLLDSALHGQGNPTPLFFLSTEQVNPDLKEVGFALGRLGEDIERAFAINGEVAFFFAPWRDFQRRSFNVMTEGLQDYARGAQSHTMNDKRYIPATRAVIVITSDPQAPSKIADWQEESQSPSTLVAIDLSNDDDAQTVRVKLLRRLKSVLGERDLYRAQNPVTGQEFFGRNAILRDASAAMLSDENVVIQGLRRSGKTSILRELKRVLLAKNVIVTLGDFQVLDAESVDSLCLSLARNFSDDLRDARKSIATLKVGAENQAEPAALSPAQLSDRIRRTASRNPGVRFVIAVDEIESAARIARTQPEKIRTFLGGLRSAAQACPNVSLAFSGVANRMFSSSQLGEGADAVDNPMFGQVTPLYLTAFRADETADLLRRLGQPMLLAWTDDAVALVHSATGGMPYFVRGLASHIRSRLPRIDADAEFLLTTITSEQVESSLPTWRESASSDWAQLIEALRLHYPDAADLLDPALTSAELNQWIASSGSTRAAAEDLQRLALLTRSSADSWVRSESLMAVHDLLRERVTKVGESLGPVGTEGGFLAAVRRGESHSLEFKETFRVNTRTGTKDAEIEAEVVRAVCGFMNGDGGTLLVGVHDAGEIRGISRDLALFRNDLDRFERWLTGDLLGRLIDPALVAAHVRVHWLIVRGFQVCAIEVSRSDSIAWRQNEHLHLRNGNQTLTLKGPEIAQFLSGRPPH